ncbi:MAG: IS256 family transposase [Saprospiraceae bacterium]|nr:IS256 family transposase [Saprospiraceae bacterium]
MKRETKRSKEFDYAGFEKEAIGKLREGRGLTGDGGALTGLIKRLLEIALDEEMEEQLPKLKEEDRSNRRNGHTKKIVKTGLGEIEIHPPRDRNGDFTPQIIGKWERGIAPEIEEQMVALYGIGTSYADIRAHLQRMYGMEYSEAFISRVTDRVSEEMDRWKNRPLERLYCIVYLDAIHYRIRQDRKVKTNAVYSVMGVDKDGKRDVLGIYIDEAEGAKYWARVLENLKDRGVEDVLFFCVDGLTGFPDSIHSVFPKSIVQRCIVHMIRTSLKFVNWKDYRAVCKDLKEVYGADSEASAKERLIKFGDKWDKKYPEIRQKWENNWVELSPFFDYPEAIRRAIYTTNAVEGLHRTLRKVTKTKGAFTSERALEKQLYLALQYSKKSWQKNVRSWSEMARVFMREFPERMGNGRV